MTPQVSILIRISTLFILGLFSATVVSAESTGVLAGTVRLEGKLGSISPKNVIVFLESQTTEKTTPRPKTHTIDMRGKMYRPGALYIQVGDSVAFKNSDRFRHNVFSLSTQDQFDLGTYRTGKSVAHTFSKLGLVKVYCNIHRNMSTFIWVGQNSWGTVTTEDGEFELQDVPPGTYKLTAWNVRGTHTQAITIDAGKNPRLNILIDATREVQKDHRNKLGKKYPARSDENEFY